MSREPLPLPYERAPKGSPDTYRLTRSVAFHWDNPPARFASLVKVPVSLGHGSMARFGSRLTLRLSKGLCFDVSVAPSAEAALPGAAPHDWLYAHADGLARAWGCPVRDVLRLADHWFLAVMRHTRFTFKRTYFLGVTLFGYWFNRLGKRFTSHL
jgi:hypothetical protein